MQNPLDYKVYLKSSELIVITQLQADLTWLNQRFLRHFVKYIKINQVFYLLYIFIDLKELKINA